MVVPVVLYVYAKESPRDFMSTLWHQAIDKFMGAILVQGPRGNRMNPKTTAVTDGLLV